MHTAVPEENCRSNAHVGKLGFENFVSADALSPSLEGLERPD
jgi:hypothetical protein